MLTIKSKSVVAWGIKDSAGNLLPFASARERTANSWKGVDDNGISRKVIRVKIVEVNMRSI